MKTQGYYEINLFFSNNENITLTTEIIEVTLEDQNKIFSLRFFSRGSSYNFLGVFGHIGIAQANLFGSYPTETQYRYRILYSNEIIQAKQSIVNSGGDGYDLTGYQYVFNKRPQYMSAGIYFSPIKHFYLKAGMASIKADQFQVFLDEGGQYRPYLQDYIFEFAEENVTGLDTYVTNPRKINKSSWLVGAALLYQNFQIEIGYNALWRSTFLSIGMNIEYDRLNNTGTMNPPQH